MYQRDSDEEETHDEVSAVGGEEHKNQIESDACTVIVPISESNDTISKVYLKNQGNPANHANEEVKSVGQAVVGSSSGRKDLSKSSKSSEEQKGTHKFTSEEAKEENDEFNDMFKYTFIPNETKNISELKRKLRDAFKSEYNSCLQQVLNPNLENPEQINEVLKT